MMSSQEEAVEPIELALTGFTQDDDDGLSGGNSISDDLFVFGYGCKIFRDDDKAKWIDDGKHLIPWMGNQSLLIDRYDARGALMDMKELEVPEKHTVSVYEKKVESICDEERYRDLREDDAEDSDYQEQEYKRLQLAVNEMKEMGNGDSVTKKKGIAIGYSYDNDEGPLNSVEKEDTKNNENAPFKIPPGLEIPTDIILPDTMKIHEIIEKTARFIASQGIQMEIILKTKQSKNPQFDFLNFNNPLNRYYKFVVEAIKSNTYIAHPIEDPQDNDQSGNEDEGENSSPERNDSYLHPSLFKINNDQSFTSKITYKSTTVHSAYSMLVSKIKEVRQSDSPENQSPNIEEADKEENGQQQNYSENSEHPSPQEALVIEKMANYVVKNGPDFESLVRTKGDPRFNFLNPGEIFHWYYLSCKEKYELESNSLAKYQASEAASEVALGLINKDYQDQDKEYKELPQREIKLSDIPMTSLTSSSGSIAIPIANLASIQNRKTTMPAELASRLEELKKKNLNKAAHATTAATECDDSSNLLVSSDKREKIKFLANSNATPKVSLHQDIFDDDIDEKPKQKRSKKDYKNEEEESNKRMQEERKRKAAIFLQKIKKDFGNRNESDEVVIVKDTKSDPMSDVESIPSPLRSPKNLKSSDLEDKPDVSEKISRRKISREYVRSRSRSKSNTPPRKRMKEKRSSSCSSVSSSSTISNPNGHRSSRSTRKRKKSKKRSKRKKSPKSKKSKKHRR